MHYRFVRELCGSKWPAARYRPQNLVDLSDSRIEARDGKLNAVVVRDFERAAAAAAVDGLTGALARGEKRPLLGVPMTVKESFNVVAWIPDHVGHSG